MFIGTRVICSYPENLNPLIIPQLSDSVKLIELRVILKSIEQKIPSQSNVIRFKVSTSINRDIVVYVRLSLNQIRNPSFIPYAYITMAEMAEISVLNLIDKRMVTEIHCHDCDLLMNDFENTGTKPVSLSTYFLIKPLLNCLNCK